MSSASPTCVIHSADLPLAMRIKGLLHERADVFHTSQLGPLLDTVSRCECVVIFLDALNEDLFEAMEALHRDHPDCPLVVLGEDGSDPILALDHRFIFSVLSPGLSNRALVRAFCVAQHQLQQLDRIRVKLSELEDHVHDHAISAPRPGQVIRGLLLAFTGFRSTADLLERFMEWIQQHYDVSEAGIYLRQPATEVFQLSVCLNEPLPDLPRSYPADHGFVQYLQGGRLVVHRSTLDRLNFTARAVCERALLHSRAEAVFPMMSATGLAGWLFVGDGFLTELSRDDLKELNMITSCLAAFVERAEEQSARLKDAEASKGLLEQLKVGALMLEVETMEVTWMNSQARMVFGNCVCLPQPLRHFDHAFMELTEAMLLREGPTVPIWSSLESRREYAVAMIGPSGARKGKAFVLLQDVTSDVLLGPDVAQPKLPEDSPRANLCTKIRDPLVAIKTFIQLLPERRLDPEFCEAFVPLIQGSIERLESLIATLERRVMESEGAELSSGPSEATGDLDYALRHLLEDVFAEIGEVLEPDRMKNTRDLYLRWATDQRRILTQHLAHLAAMEGWGRAAVGRDLILEWKELAEMGQICLIVLKGDAMSVSAQPKATAALDGLRNFLERLGGSLDIQLRDRAYSLSLILPQTNI